MPKINGLHHYSIKCENGKAFDRVMGFYRDLLGLSVMKSGETFVMLDTGNGLVEIFNTGAGEQTTGAIRHIAFEVDDVDAWAKLVKEAGYEVFNGPKDIETPVKARIAFCYGPVGEQVEFFRAY